MFSYKCPECGQHMSAPPERTGKKATCVKCFATIRVPRPSEAEMEEIYMGHGNINLEHINDDLSDHILDLDFAQPNLAALEQESGLPDGLQAEALPTRSELNLVSQPTRPEALQDDACGFSEEIAEASVQSERSIKQLSEQELGSRHNIMIDQPPLDVTSTPVPKSKLRQPTNQPSTLPPVTEAKPRTQTPRPSTSPTLSPSVGPVPAMRRAGPMPLNRQQTGMVSLEPTGLASVDVAAELTAALTLRMKPPPEPPADLALTTGIWFLLLLCAAVAWFTGVFFMPNTLPFVILIGLFMFAFGYGWCAYLVGRNNPAKGILTLLPPLNLYRMLTPIGENAYRPLRFALSGLLCVALYWVGLPAREGMQAIYRAFDVERLAGARTELKPHQKLKEQLEQQQWEELSTNLLTLQDPVFFEEATKDEKAELISYLVKTASPEFCPRSDIRSTALSILSMHSKEQARPCLMKALGSPEHSERRYAIRLAKLYPDAEVATLVAGRLSSRTEENAARDALTAMPDDIAELALLAVINLNDQIGMLQIAEMLEKVGGEQSIQVLQKFAERTFNRNVQIELQRHIEAIKNRLKS